MPAGISYMRNYRKDENSDHCPAARTRKTYTTREPRATRAGPRRRARPARPGLARAARAVSLGRFPPGRRIEVRAETHRLDLVHLAVGADLEDVRGGEVERVERQAALVVQDLRAVERGHLVGREVHRV